MENSKFEFNNELDTQAVVAEILSSAQKIMSEQLHGIAQTFVTTMVEHYTNELTSGITAVTEAVSNQIKRVLSEINFSELASGIADVSQTMAFVNALKQVKWPLYLVDDKQVREQIIQKSKNYNREDFSFFVFTYFENIYFKKMVQNWNENLAIRSERLPVLREALLLHEQKAYYGATSIMMCQIYGIISDITDIMKKHDIVISADDKEEIANLFSVKNENIDNEKGKMLQAISIVEGRLFEWSAFADYLMEEILCSSDSKKRWAEQPLRNKICHGDQLNFGTQEHSVKSILVVDMLIQLAEEINYLAEQYSTDNQKVK